jgi:hypothetical protein
MDLVKDDEFDISNQISSRVEHTPQNLSCHLSLSWFCKKYKEWAYDQTTTLGVDLHITSQNTDRRRIEGRFEISKFLIGECFDWRCVDSPCNQLPA